MLTPSKADILVATKAARYSFCIADVLNALEIIDSALGTVDVLLVKVRFIMASNVRVIPAKIMFTRRRDPKVWLVRIMETLTYVADGNIETTAFAICLLVMFFQATNADPLRKDPPPSCMKTPCSLSSIPVLETFGACDVVLEELLGLVGAMLGNMDGGALGGNVELLCVGGAVDFCVGYAVGAGVGTVICRLLTPANAETLVASKAEMYSFCSTAVLKDSETIFPAARRAPDVLEIVKLIDASNVRLTPAPSLRATSNCK